MEAPPDARDKGEVTALLRAWSEGDTAAFERVMPLVYGELHRMAVRYLAGERAHISLQATALVNEVCLRLIGWKPGCWENRSHFFGVSAQMMRRVLVDIARKRRAERRGGPAAARVTLDGLELAAGGEHPDLAAVDEALVALEAEDVRKARVVELRFFGGLSIEETAEALKVSPRTVRNDWTFARAWLYRALAAGSTRAD
jgi:RNA polymerase sigma-70 factor (ECF subfamily)